MPLPRFIQKLTNTTSARPGPIIILSAPRAGAALLARLLAQANHAVSLGLDARAQTEAALAPYRALQSDRVLADAATPEVSAQVRQALGLTANTWTIEHAGAYALRVPFLAAALPEARFVMLARDPREQIARTIAAWRSGRFITYPALTGWAGPWSLALIPGWEALRGESIAEIALSQWATTTATLLDDLAMVPDERWCIVRYETLRADVRGTMRTLQALGLQWRRHPRMVEVLASPYTPGPADLEAVDLLLPRADPVLRRLRATMRARGLVEEVPQRLRRLPGSLRRHLARGSVAAALLGATLPTAQTAHAATFNVTNLNDTGAGSLRQAIDDANTAAGADVITFQPGLAGTITLTSGQLSVTDSVDIQGPGASALSVSGNNTSRIFYLYNGSAALAVTISGLTIADGNATIGGGIINFDEDLTLDGVTLTGNSSSGDGAGLWADGFSMDLVIRNSIISGNTSGADGGGIYIEDTGGPLVIQSSQIINNNAAVSGGGIYFYDPDNTVTIEATTISGNTAGSLGGGVYLYSPDNGVFTIRTTTISGNTAASGGGLFLYSPDHGLVIENSTISGNRAISGDGGGIYVYSAYPVGSSSISHSTITGNSAAGSGGGLMVMSDDLQVAHTIVANNIAPSNADMDNGVEGSFGLGFSLVEVPGTAAITDLGGNILNEDPQLGPLAASGGPTETHLLATGSPAINAGNPAFAPPPATDQRSSNRVAGGMVDIGAVEMNFGTLELTASSLNVNENGISATLTVTRTGGSDGTVTVGYATADGTATAGSDYTATNGILSWAHGDSAPQTITIPVTNDATIESDETFTVVLSNPTGATLGATALATITIVDDDPAESSYQVFLPDVAVNLQPDLVVTRVLIAPSKTSFAADEPVVISVTITNQGKASTTPFWVDLYLEPSEEPAVNKTWYMVCKLEPCYGIAWGVVEQLAPGQSITLTSAVTGIDGRYSNWKGYFASGTTRMVVLADSYNPASPTGAMSESNEANNALSLALSVIGTNPTAETSDVPAALPERPAIPQQ